jgi:hypothetical protein
MTMTDNNTTAETTNPADNIHRTTALDKMGFGRCRKDNKLFSWRKGGACKVCGARVEDAPTAAKAKRSRKAATSRDPAAAIGREETVPSKRKPVGRVEEVSEPSPFPF